MKEIKVRILPTTVATPWGGRLDLHAIISVKTGKVLGQYVDPKNAQRRVDNEGWVIERTRQALGAIS